MSWHSSGCGQAVDPAVTIGGDELQAGDAIWNAENTPFPSRDCNATASSSRCRCAILLVTPNVERVRMGNANVSTRRALGSTAACALLVRGADVARAVLLPHPPTTPPGRHCSRPAPRSSVVSGCLRVATAFGERADQSARSSVATRGIGGDDRAIPDDANLPRIHAVLRAPRSRSAFGARVVPVGGVGRPAHRSLLTGCREPASLSAHHPAPCPDQ